jgi:pimeloyl-ACP methyl ester carboxylesterase
MSKVSNVVLVHGAWADGSSWSKVIAILQRDGFAVTAVQLPLTSLKDDVATVLRAVKLIDGPLVLAGHSYGGAVITQAGTDPKVSALAYVAAFAPDTGESAGSLLASVPPSPIAAEIRPDPQGFLRLTEAGVLDCFAQDLPEADRRVLHAVQGPTSGQCLGGAVADPAWKSKPAWYVVAEEDRAIPPALQHAMARKIGAHTVSFAASHVAMLSRPSDVAAVIAEAATLDAAVRVAQ